MKRTYPLVLLGVIAGLLTPGVARAHYCSNIFGAYARIVVKPEKTTVNVTGGKTSLKVYMQNNFPYKLTGVQMRGSSSGGYTVSVSPSSQSVHPGQKVLYTVNISGSGGSVAVSSLNLQVKIRIGGWQGQGDEYVSSNPSQSNLIAASKYGSSGGQQSPSLNAAILADRFPSAKISSMLGRTGMEQLIHWFGYRFCYNSSGSYQCGSQACPGSCAEGSSWSSTAQFPQNCMRAGVDIAIRKAKLGSKLQAARAAAINAMKGGSSEHRCLAAVVGGHLWKGSSSTSSFKSALNSLPTRCKSAGLRALGEGSQSSCTSGQFYEKAACAAAEGLRGNHSPVKSVLMPSAGDNTYTKLYYSYMLYMVSGDSWAQGKQPAFFPQVGPPPADKGTNPTHDQGTNPKQDMGASNGDGSVNPGTDSGGGNSGSRGDDGCRVGSSAGGDPSAGAALALLGLLMLLRGRRRQ